MLNFIRKYQRYFYLVITVVIIVSFSFFGTYSTLGGDAYREQIAFTAVDGTQVTRGELEQLVMFISTDADDKLLFGGIWGPNFLNDGVIRKDFLASGLAEQLLKQYASDMSPDLDRRLEKEKHFTPYVHPQAGFISVEMAWNYMAPNIKAQYELLRMQSNATDPEAINARIQLYLAERELPAPALMQVLHRLQRQNSWLQPDPNLERTDLSLFGYHTLDDWFGPRFLRLVGEFIINSAKIASQKGYKVTKEEALADLKRNAEQSYRDNAPNPHIGVANSNEYFNEQLQRYTLDQNKAARIWTQVLLFRRLFQDVGQAVFVDPQSLQPLNSYAKATVEGDLYRLPDELQFSQAHTLLLFETYLKAISSRPQLLNLPTKFLPLSEIPSQLQQKRYLVDIAQVNKNVLQARVGIKESWNWETDDKNWETLKLQFPDLANKKASNKEERLAALDSLDERTRGRVDVFARQAIVDAHPEWIEKALSNAEPQRKTIALHMKGETTPLTGFKNPATLIALLDKAKLGEQDPTLSQVSGDNLTYYKIVVIDRSANPEILTFAEASEDGTLEALLEIKSNAETEEQMAALKKAIYDDYASAIAPEKAPKELLDDVAASLRFYSIMRDIEAKLKKDPQSAAPYIRSEAQEEELANQLPKRSPLDAQWQLIKSSHREERSGEIGNIALPDLFSMNPGTFSRVYTPVSGDLSFFYLKNRGSDATVASLDNMVTRTHHLLSDEAEQELMRQVLNEITAKKAISLEFMQPKEDDPSRDDKD